MQTIYYTANIYEVAASSVMILYYTTKNVLDHDQSNYSSRIIFSYTFTLEPNTNWTG